MSSRLAIAGGLLAATLLVGGGFLIGRNTLSRVEPEASASASLPVAAPSTAEALGVLDRADILAIGARAADALASGLSPEAGDGDLAGRRFDLVIPFGCEGDAPPGNADPLHWRYDADKQTLRIHVAPIRWDGGDWDALFSPDGTARALQGFWVSHPWTSLETCPQGNPTGQPIPATPVTPTDEAAPEIQPAVPVERTLALAEVLPSDMKQARRGDRPYEIVKRMAPERFDPKQGFRLRLKGRIDRLPGGQSIRCAQPQGIEQRPACVIGMSLNEVRIENPLDGEVLATWTTNLEDRVAP